jgi:hypothetical protein
MPNKITKGLLVIIGFLYCLVLQAGIKDTIKPPTPIIKDSIKPGIDSLAKFYFYPDQFGHLKQKDYKPVDTMLTAFQKYDPAGIMFPFHTSLGNIGLANKSMVFARDSYSGFDLGNHSFDSYLFSNEQLKYFRGLTPYSDLFYLMGAKKEQYFNAVLSRNLSKNFTMGINYRLVRSIGRYKWQETSNTNAALTALYTATNKRYGLLASYVFNRLLSTENGGVAPDFIHEFENNEGNRDIVTVNVIENQVRRNNFRESSFYLKQFYCFGWNKTIKLTDTTDEKVFKSLGTITHTAKFDRQSIFYEDNKPQSGFYRDILIDSTNTFDSLHFSILENKISLTNEGGDAVGGKYFLLYNIGIRHQLISVSQTVFKPFVPYSGASEKLDTTLTTLLDTTFQQFILEAGLRSDPEQLISLGANVYRVFGGYNDQDMGFHADAIINFSDSAKTDNFIRLNAGYTENETPWLRYRYYSNHVRWDNNFLKIKTLYSGINWTYKSLSLKLNYAVVGNYVYFDTLIQPRQYSSNANIASVSLAKDFKFGKWSFDNQVVYQKVLLGDSVIRLPEFIFNHSFYYNGVFFKGALLSQFGLDIFYNSSYYADAYVPGIRDYYLQNHQLIGNYPYVDVFLNFKIKRVRFFVMYQHVTMGLFGYRYYTTPYYPMQDRALKLGLSWIFHS